MNRLLLHCGISMLIVTLLTLFAVPTSFAQEFTARYLGDFGNVTVMEVSGNYDVKNGDGSYNAEPRQIISREFYKLHRDEYDFLVIFTNYDFKMAEKGTVGSYEGVKNDTQGIGVDPFDRTSLYGSNRKLQGTIDMGNLNNIVSDPLNPKFEEVLITLNHELMHRWGAHVKFRDLNGADSMALLGDEGSHWSFLLDTADSVMYGNRWRDNGNGTFTSLTPQSRMNAYSPLDLYLMGMIDKSKVPPMLLIDSPGADPSQLPQSGVTVPGTAGYITIDEIISTNGPRIPDSSTSQKSFKSAFILLTQQGTFTGNEIYSIENIRSAWITRHSILTDGKSIIEVSSTPRDDLPSGPGILPPATTPRILPADINDGVQWLVNNQNGDGSWSDLFQTAQRDTAMSALSLRGFSSVRLNYQYAIQWLSSLESVNVDFLSRKIMALAGSGQALTSIVNDLVSRQNSDGGWGSEKNYASNPTDTALALKALFASGFTDQTVIGKAITYIKVQQNADGGWGSEDKGGMVQETSNVLSAFNANRSMYQLEDAISRGANWLIGKQNPDGGFGNSPSTVYDTAVATITLRELNVSTDITNEALAYLLDRQSEEGSWNNSAYETALSVYAVFKATVDPDLSLASDDITIIPDKMTSLPSDIVVNANIKNLGQTGVQAKVVLYEGPIAEVNKIGEQTITFLGQSTTTVTFSSIVKDGNEHLFFIVVDPENLVKESNERNNTAVKALYPEATYDFEILPQDITVSMNPVNQFQDAKITAKIKNSGTMTAYNVQVKFFIDEPGNPSDIGILTIDAIPAGGAATTEIAWRATKTGTDLPLAVQVDPNNIFIELSKTNNSASTRLTVNAANYTDPNISVSFKDIIITPNPVNQGGSVSISALIKNEGYAAAEGITVNFYCGFPNQGGLLIGSGTIATLAPSENTIVSVDWVNIQKVGDNVIYVQVNYGGQEINEADNDAFTTLKVLSAPDFTISTDSIVFNPSVPKLGDIVSIFVTVQNIGDQDAYNVPISAYEGNIHVGSQFIPFIPGNYSRIISFSYDTTGKTGSHDITVIVDPDSTIPEKNKNNNRASRIFTILDAALAVSEPYFSPNGDGVKDATQFSFMLETPQVVKVVVVNTSGKTVRTFSGSESLNSAGGAITWDGLEDDGTVVDDGSYRIQVEDLNGNILKSSLVTVDNNGAPFSDAIGTSYLLNNRIETINPVYNDLIWFPDEKGFLFYDRGNASGLYFISSDGQQKVRIVPSEWSLEKDPQHQYYYTYEISPKGDKIAIEVRTYNYYYSRWDSTQLWVVNPDGTNLTMLDSYVLSGSGGIYDIRWSPDGKYISYQVYGSDGKRSVRLVRPDGTRKILLENSYDYPEVVRWSADGTRLLYSLGHYDYSTGNYKSVVKVSDTAADKNEIFSSDHLNEYDWIGNDNVVAEVRSQVDIYRSDMLVVPANGTETISQLLSGVDISSFRDTIRVNSWHPFQTSLDGQSFAFLSWAPDGTHYGSYYYGTLSINILDSNGIHSVAGELDKADQGCLSGSQQSLQWATDSRRLLLKLPYECFGPDKPHNNELLMLDSLTRQMTYYACPDCTSETAAEFLSPAQLLPNGNTAIVASYRWRQDPGYIVRSARFISALNLQTGEFSAMTSTVFRSSNESGSDVRLGLLSPLGDYVTYESFNQSSGYWIWAMRSLLNLPATLHATRDQTGVTLSGIATDLNFKEYALEYADTKSPDVWYSIAPPAGNTVVNDVFARWVPPYEGTFNVRLTARDKAGNARAAATMVSWGQYSGIAGMYLNRDLFSPNGDGTNETVELHYRVNEPANLEFKIYDEDETLITVMERNLISAADDYVVWDGRDSQGSIVPDGRYKIKVQTQEFYVEVDSTPPDAYLEISPMKQSLLQDLDDVGLSTSLLGHASDLRIKEWRIEYGEGNNPGTWFEVKRGSEILATNAETVTPLTGPIGNATVLTYKEQDIEWLVGKKFRITAEDVGGNKRTFSSGFVPEKILFYKWDDLAVDVTDEPSLGATYGTHKIRIRETIREPLEKLTVQYEQNDLWYNAQTIASPASGDVELIWDNSGLDASYDHKVRIQAVDAAGRIFYSNSAVIGRGAQFLVGSPCEKPGSLSATILLPEKLAMLRFQLLSAMDPKDPDYNAWTDFKVYNAALGDIISAGSFTIDAPSMKNGINYGIRMIGTGVSGKTYESNTIQSGCKVSVQLSFYPLQAGCNQPSDKTDVTASIADLGWLVGNATNAVLKISGYKNGRYQLLLQLDQADIVRSGGGRTTVNTADMPEGSYTYDAVLTYLDLNDHIVKGSSHSDVLRVERALPTSHITSPTLSQRTCLVKTDDRYSLPVSGIVADTNRVKKYSLFYKPCELLDGTEWCPAKAYEDGEAKEIAGNTAVNGLIGYWDVTGKEGTSFTLKLQVEDVTGNVSCNESDIVLDAAVSQLEITLDRNALSPNDDHLFDDLAVNYNLDEYATVELKVFDLSGSLDGYPAPGAASLRAISSGEMTGKASLVWDGRTDSGEAVPDGKYGLSVRTHDACDNAVTKWFSVDVDNTAPTAVITYPKMDDVIGNVVEIKGTADDAHLLSYVLEAGQGSTPETWTLISSRSTPVQSGLLGTWETFGLEGIWTMKLTVSDSVGNKAENMVVVDLKNGLLNRVITDYSVNPGLFSPNNDGKTDSITVNYGLAEASTVRIEIIDENGTVRKLFTDMAASPGARVYTWDGVADSGTVVPDGPYSVKITAALAADSSVSQTETATVYVDTTPPSIDIVQPVNEATLKDDGTVKGTISDQNLAEYSLTYIGKDGAVVLDQGNSSRTHYNFGVLSGLAEGTYTLVARAEDRGENTAEKTMVLSVDRTPPAAKLESPLDGEYYGGEKNYIAIKGSIIENNLETYSVRYGSGEFSTQWTELMTGHTVPANDQLFVWNVGAGSGVEDGVYTLSLFATDRAGSTGETALQVIIDNTAPQAVITLPKDGDYVKSDLEVKGTAFDQHLDVYTLAMSEGACDSAFKWSVIKTGTVSITDGTLAANLAPPADGDYCLKLTVADKIGNKTETRINWKVDTQPPAAPSLSGTIENGTGVRLEWTQSPEPDIAGYNLFRNGQKINDLLITDVFYVDQILADETYFYTVRAVDRAGWESQPSNEFKIRSDSTGPSARISSPQDGTKASGTIEINGTAYSMDDFKQYRIYFGQGANPAFWSLIRMSPVPVSQGLLTSWDTADLADGQYILKLEAEDTAGHTSTHTVAVIIDTTPPSAPVLLSATSSGADLTITWQPNAEVDLAGYLLYRNGQVVGTSGSGLSNLNAYLLDGTTYIDKALPDGSFTYHVISSDLAGNISSPSNAINVSIDTHAPHAEITEPADNATFENKILIKAESPDQDVATVQFEFKGISDSSWTTFGNVNGLQPFGIYFDANGLGLAYGEYQVRATATDRAGKTDTAPSYRTIRYADLTAPTVPVGLTTVTDGANVTCTWERNTENDLSGYNVYSLIGGTKNKVNAAPITEGRYQVTNLPDGTASFAVSALDNYGNESMVSSSASARVYAPVLALPVTPVTQSPVLISGANAEVNARISITVQGPSGYESQSAASADSMGNFSASLELPEGESIIAARATDCDGNVSRVSNTVSVVYHQPPASPTGLTAIVQDHTVILSWNTNTESDLAGYKLYRDGEKIGGGVAPVTAGAASSSPPDIFMLPSYAFDGIAETSWTTQCEYVNEQLTPIWWELDFQHSELLKQIAIHWGSAYIYIPPPDGVGKGTYNQVPAGGTDYQVQAWSGNSWVTLETVEGNTDNDNVLDLTTAYQTEKMRFYITKTMTNQQLAISEVGISVYSLTSLITDTSYSDVNVVDGKHHYTLTAVDRDNLESLPSDDLEAAVGDVVPPAAPQNLSAQALASSTFISWSANMETDLAGYNVYKYITQTWIKLNPTLMTSSAFTDLNLVNGTYLYRVTAVDDKGNESQPSDTMVTIAAILPPAPTNLNITSAPEGKTLTLTWQHPGGSVIGFDLYRGVHSGGPYTRINGTIFAGNTYVDENLVNGVTYYYVTVSVDSLGNVSAYSDQAAGVPRDSLPPSKPKIYSPAVPSLAPVLFDNGAVAAGSADPGSLVEVFINNNLQGIVPAREEDAFSKVSLSNCCSNGLDLSNNGSKIVFSDGSSKIWVKNINTGTAIDTGQTGIVPRWSPDAKYFLYFSSGRLYVYDIEKTAVSPLTGEAYFEYGRTWSPDSQQIAFETSRSGSREIWSKNLKTGTLQQITHSGYAADPKWSPDGKNIAYRDNSGNVFAVSLQSGISTKIDSGITDSQYEWAPDAGRIAYIINNALWTYDMKAQSRAQLATTASTVFMPVWSPDGETVLFAVWDNALRKYSIASKSIVTDHETVLTPSGLNGYPSSLLWSASGRIAYTETNAVTLIDLKGQFLLDGIRLQPGENILNVMAKDESGNTSPVSDSVIIEYDTSLLPDAEVADDEIYLYPPLPVAGEQTAINIAVWNKGGVEAKDVEVDIYMWNANGQLEWLSSKTIPSIAAQSAELVSATWDSTGKVGENRLVVAVDTDDSIVESEETNNLAIRDFIVSDHAGITITATTDARQYESNQNVVAVVTLWNNGDSKDVVLNAQIKDDSGHPVAAFDTINASMAYGQQSYSFTWNTNSTLAGSYRLHSVLTDATGLLSENTETFTIIEDANLDLSVATDKPAYGANENVITNFSVKNAGVNYIIPASQSTVAISNAAGAVLFSEAKPTSNLLPGSSVDLSSSWNTALTAPGRYNAIVAVSSNGVPTLTKSISFTINAVFVLTGNITATPSIDPVGSATQLTYTVSNSGNIDALGSTMRISVIDPDTQTVVQTQDQNVDIAKNTSKTGQIIMSTAGFRLKTYTALLQLLSQGTTKNIANTSFTVKDLTPPVVTVLSPRMNGLYNSVATLSALAVDDASGVDKVEYQIDGGPWYPLPPADPTQGRYTTTWDSSLEGDGGHSVSFQASDKAGNVSAPVTVGFTVQTLTPPIGNIQINGGEQYTNSSTVTLTLSCTSIGSACVHMSFSNDAALWSDPETYGTKKEWHLAPEDGLKNVYVRYINIGGTTSAVYPASIVLDATSPALSMSTLHDGAYTNNATLNVTGKAVDNIALHGVTINGTSITINEDGTFSQAITLVTGTNAVTTIATDQTGNKTTDIRIITLDRTLPVVTILAPADNSVTNTVDAMVAGTVDKISTVTVDVNNRGPVYADMSGNNFSLPVMLLYGQNTIEIAAIDLATNLSIVKRTVTLDDQKPALSVMYPGEDMTTDQDQITLMGQVSDLTLVTVAIDVGGNINTPVVESGCFSQSLTFTDPKTYQISVTAIDEAGNQSLVQRNVIFNPIQQNFGIFGATGVSISGGYVDSYDSSKGAYDGVRGSGVSVGTNSTAKGAINLSGGAAIYGDVFVGPGGDLSKSLTTSGGAVIYGSQAGLTSLKDMAPVSDSGGGTPASFKNGTTLTTGTYRVSSINLSGNGIGTIDGDVVLYITGNLNLSGGSQIVIMPGGSLTVYLGGKLNVSGGAIINKTLDPHNLTIYGTATCTSVGYSGNSDFYGTVYAPAARVSISSGNAYGSLIGGSVSISGGAAVHYDESL